MRWFYICFIVYKILSTQSFKCLFSKSQASLNSLASRKDLGSCCECDRMDRTGQAISCKSRKCVQEEYGMQIIQFDSYEIVI